MSNVAEARAKTLKITLNDGVERNIKFTLNALAEIEEKYGSVDAAFEKLEKENSMRALRTILWAGFLHENPSITEMQVGNLIDLSNMPTLVESLNTAFEDSMPEVVQPVGVSEVAGSTSPNA